MDTTLKIHSHDLDPEDLQRLTRELSRTLKQETGVNTTMPEGPAGPGARGDPITLGTIIITALSSGTVVALFHVLKSYFERKPTLEIEFQRPDGNTFKIRAETLGQAQVDETIRLAKDFWGL
ncbi:MAG: hypothetical protein P8017_17290 [Deltaproteobacteria bacterium]